MATAAPPRFKAHPIPPTELDSREQIGFLHPGYLAPTNVLLSLPRVDHIADTTTFGVYHRTALLACQVISDNAFDTGRLTLDRVGQQPVNVPFDGILTEKAYYVIVSDSPGMYLLFYFYTRSEDDIINLHKGNYSGR